MVSRTALPLAMAASWLPATCVFAFQPLVTDDTGTQGANGNQVEFAATQTRRDASAETSVARVLPFVVTRGLTDRMDLFVQANHTSVRTSSSGDTHRGGGNPSIGLKWRFYDDARTSFGIKPEILLPVSSGAEAAGLGHGKASCNLAGLFSRETSFGALHANIVASRHRNRDATLAPELRALRFSVAPVLNLGNGWTAALDLGSERATAGGRVTRSRLAELGAIYAWRDDIDVAIGVIRTLERGAVPATTTIVTTGVTWRIR